jgi:hypothetical protein
MVIGSEKGYLYPYDIMTDPKTKKVRLFYFIFETRL